jgi:4-hydroxybenzoate polyprenyltransferase
MVLLITNKFVLKKAANYISLVKFSHTVFALPFALIGFFLAIRSGNYNTSFIIQHLALVLLCMVFGRNTAMSFNRYVDRHIDSLNPRTLMREIPATIIKPGSALFFSIINGILFCLTAYFINMLCFFLSPVALIIITGYSFTKRFTSLSHLILGLGLSLAPIGAYIAVTGSFALLPLIYSIIVLFWVAGFDIIYALQDTEFDNTHNLKSIPAWIGMKNGLTISLLFHVISATFVLVAGIIGISGYLYWTGAFIFIVLLGYQHLIIKDDDLSRVNVAFFTLNGFASIIFSIFVIADLYLA